MAGRAQQGGHGLAARCVSGAQALGSEGPSAGPWQGGHGLAARSASGAQALGSEGQGCLLVDSFGVSWDKSLNQASVCSFEKQAEPLSTSGVCSMRHSAQHRASSQSL